jgi:hypothetical protein
MELCDGAGLRRGGERTGDPVSPVAVAVAVSRSTPATVPSVRIAESSPEELVNAASGAIDPPPAVTPQATATPATGFPNASVTRTTYGSASGVPTTPD